MLTGYANLLNNFPPEVAQAGNVSAENFALWLRRYVYQHTRGVLAFSSCMPIYILAFHGTDRRYKGI
jgi:hypothetical protein|eukprot:COSAG03_NODE_2420_length_2792_cov_3.174527_2_plen_67_part_00